MAIPSQHDTPNHTNWPRPEAPETHAGARLGGDFIAVQHFARLRGKARMGRPDMRSG